MEILWIQAILHINSAVIVIRVHNQVSTESAALTVQNLQVFWPRIHWLKSSVTEGFQIEALGQDFTELVYMDIHVPTFKKFFQIFANIAFADKCY